MMAFLIHTLLRKEGKSDEYILSSSNMAKANSSPRFGLVIKQALEEYKQALDCKHEAQIWFNVSGLSRIGRQGKRREERRVDGNAGVIKVDPS